MVRYRNYSAMEFIGHLLGTILSIAFFITFFGCFFDLIWLASTYIDKLETFLSKKKHDTTKPTRLR